MRCSVSASTFQAEEQRRGEVVYRAAEVGVVEDVEEVRAGLQPDGLGEGEGSAKGEIDLGGAESAQGIASQIALPAGGNTEGRFGGLVFRGTERQACQSSSTIGAQANAGRYGVRVSPEVGMVHTNRKSIWNVYTESRVLGVAQTESWSWRRASR
jgi:hypothetical protein